MRPLEGITVVALEQVIAGPFATRQLAELGARVIAAASSEEKLEVCRRFGADATINYSTEDLRERVKALTDGKGIDVCLDNMGGRCSPR